MSDIPLVMSAAGPVPTSTTALQQALIALVEASNPDYTSNLPGSLIEDLSSTAVGALYTLDQARVDALNSVSPYGANAFVLSQMGAQAGIAQGAQTNTSVYVVFSGTVGYVITAGFIVSDGTYQYMIQDGGVIASGGSSSSLYAVASQSGSWAVPANTVTQIVTSVASGITLTVTNAETGTPSSDVESVQDYRLRVQQAQQVTVQGVGGFMKTLLEAISGVTPRLVSVQQVPSGWEVICGGGDEYSVAYAIYQAAINLSSIIGSTTTARNITATIVDGYDSYDITFVNPPEQTVTMDVVWNTNLANFTGGYQVNQLAATALQSYINSITVGQPINELVMTNLFQEAVISVLPEEYLSSLTFTVYINGVETGVSAGTSIIPSDSESYFYASDSAITVTQG